MYVEPIHYQKQSAKSERLEARVSRDVKYRLQQAAEIKGSSLTEFITRSAEEAANEVLREHQMLKLSDEDSCAFVKALFTASKPNRRLRSAYTNYKKEVSSQA